MASDPSILAMRAQRQGGTSWLVNRSGVAGGATSVGFTVQPSIVGTGKIGAQHILNLGTAPGANIVGQLRRGAVILVPNVTNGQIYVPVAGDNLTNLVLDVVATVGVASVPASAFIAITYVAPEQFITQPTITPDVAIIGSLFALTYGEAQPGGIYSIEYFRLNGQSRLSELIDLTWSSINEPMGIITYKVRYTNSGGFVLSNEITANLTVTANAPVGVVAPTLSGTPSPASTLTQVQFLFTGEGVLTYDYIWQSGGVTIAGATSASFVLRANDATASVRGAVRATDSLGRRSAYIYSDPVDVDYTGLVFLGQPSFNAASYIVGNTLILDVGSAAPNAELVITTFTLDGVDKRAELVQVNATVWTWNSTAQTPGAVRFQVTASNTSQTLLSSLLTVPLNSASLVAPGAVADAGWSVVNEGVGGSLIFTVITPPTNGGTAITNYEVQQDALPALSLGISAPGSITISGFSLTVSSNYLIRAVNSVGPGPWSVTPKAATAADTKAPETTAFTYNTALNEATHRASETAKKYWLVNQSAVLMTGAAIKAAVLAATPVAFGTINIGVTEVTPNFTGMVAGPYVLHIASEDATVNVEPVGEFIEFDWPGQADTVAPVISAPTALKNGTSAFTGTFVTNEGNGTGRVVATTSLTKPTGLQIESAQDYLGATAPSAASVAISAAGTINVSGGGLPAGFVGYLHYFHRDQAGNPSTVETSPQFTTDAASGQADFVSSTLMISTSSTGDGPVYSSTTSHVVSSEANRVVLIQLNGLSEGAALPPSITSVVFGGVTATEIRPPSSSSTRDWSALYMVIAPTAGSKTCVVTLSAAQRAFSARATETKNVHQTTPVAASGSETSGSSFVNTFSFSRVAAAGNLLVSRIGLESGGLQAEMSVGGGGTMTAAEQTGTTAASDVTTAAAYELTPTAGANGHSYSWTTTKRCSLAWVELLKAA